MRYTCSDSFKSVKHAYIQVQDNLIHKKLNVKKHKVKSGIRVDEGKITRSQYNLGIVHVVGVHDILLNVQCKYVQILKYTIFVIDLIHS